MLVDEHGHYWLSLDPHAYLRSEGSDVLLYSAITGHFRWWQDVPRLATLAQELLGTHPLPPLRLSGADLIKDEVLRAFATEVVEGFMGDLVDDRLSSGSPMQTMPLTHHPRVDNAGAVPPIDVIRELTVYVNASCSLGCDCCMFAHRQAAGCGMFDGVSNELPLQDFRRVIDELGQRAVPITITGGNVLAYSYFRHMLDVVASRVAAGRVRLVVHMDNVRDDPDTVVHAVQRGAVLTVIVPWAFQRANLAALTATLQDCGADAAYVFRVKDECDITRAGDAANDMDGTRIRLSPILTGDNASFFERRVFLDVPRLRDSRPSLATVHANAVVNRLGFGRLVVRSNGEICANEATQPLGTLGNDGLAGAARRELEGEGVWLQTRGDVTPCARCVFSCICPPLSRYEYAIGRNNLCRIWNGTTPGTPDRRAAEQ